MSLYPLGTAREKLKINSEIIEIHHPLHSFVHISVNYIFDETKILQKQAKSKSKYLSFVWVSRKVVILIFYFCTGLCDANILFAWMSQISNQHSLIRGDPFFKGQSYWPEQFWPISSYQPELFRPISFYWPEPLKS